MLVLILWCGLLPALQAQGIVQGEFFWDNDPGTGNGLPLVVTDGNYDEAVEAASLTGIGTLSNGFHTLNTRFVGQGNQWGPTFTTVIHIDSLQPVSLGNITAGEFFWDSDPGTGNGIPLVVTDGNYDEAVEAASLTGIGTLSNGFHTLNTRFVGQGNQWGPIFTTVLYIDSLQPVSLGSITAGEFFWDSDPGTGNGIPLVVADGNYDEAVEAASLTGIGTLSNGFHTLNTRFVGQGNQWGPTFTTVLYIDSLQPISLGNLTAGEFFWDSDPGTGNGIPLVVADGNYDEAVEAASLTGISTLSNGFHTLNTRFVGQGNQWGPTFTTVLYIDSLQPISLGNITAGEFFWDSDPGTGNGIPLVVADGNYDEAVEAASLTGIGTLSHGFHTLNTRFVGQGNQWGPTFTTVIHIDSLQPVSLGNLTAGELFWDSDPGPGNGIPMFSADGNFDEAIESARYTALSTGALGLGGHVLYSRMRDQQSNWGPAFGVVVWVDTSLVPVISQVNGQQSFCANDSLNGISYNVNHTVGQTYTWTVSGGTLVGPATGPTVLVNWSGVGTHSLTVEACNTHGCGMPVSIVVDVLPAATATISAAGSTAFCYGDSLLLMADSTAGFQVQWYNNGLPINGATNSTLMVYGSGSYTVEVGVGTNCPDNSAPLVVNVAPSLLADAGPDQLACSSGDSLSLGGTPAVSGGLTPYTFAWSPSTGLSNPSTANPKVALNGSGTYILHIVDSLGCAASDTVSLGLNPPIVTSLDTLPGQCPGQGVVLGGAPTASGGSGGFQYLWSPAAGLNSPALSNPTANPANSTWYTVQVTDAAGCITSDSVYYEVYPGTVLDPGADTSICYGGQVPLGGFPTASGSSGYVYNWSPASSLNNSSLPNPTANPLVSTAYQLQVTDSLGCTFEDSILVTVNGPIVLDPGPDTLLCFGESLNLGGSPTATGGQGFSYSWTPATGLNNPAAANPITSTTSDQVYVLQVIDNLGCTETDSIRVGVNPAIQVNPGMDTSACAGDQLVLGGNPTGAGGSGVLSYNWTPGTGLQNPNSSNPTVTAGPSTAYTVLVTDDNGCTQSDQVMLTVSPLPIADFSSQVFSDSVAFGNLSQHATSQVWDFGDGNTSTGFAPSHTYAVPGTYTVCLISSNACAQDTFCQTVFVNFVDVESPLSSYFYRVYPNPNTGQFYFRTSQSGNFHLVIRNLLGQEVFQRHVYQDAGQESLIDYGPLSKGVYQLEVHFEDRVMVEKMILRE